jgi:hypothetical protein
LVGLRLVETERVKAALVRAVDHGLDVGVEGGG